MDHGNEVDGYSEEYMVANIRPCPVCHTKPQLVQMGHFLWYVNDPCEYHSETAATRKGAIYEYNIACALTDELVILKAWDNRTWKEKVWDFITRKTAPTLSHNEW